MAVRVALVGLGRWAEAHAAAAGRSERVAITSCFSRRPHHRADFADRWSIPTAARSYEEVLADSMVDAVLVATPNDLHVDMALQAIDAGKAVLVDKPVAVSVQQGLPLLRAVRRADAGRPPLAVAHHPRRLAGQRAIEHWYHSGQAGEIRTVHATFSNNRGRSMAPEAWHRRVAGAEAGVLIQVGIHQVDNVCSLLGPAETVSATFVYGELGPTMPVTAMLTTTHRGQTSASKLVVASISSSWATPGHYRFDVEATNANMEYRLDHRHWSSAEVDDHGELIVEPTDGERRSYSTSPGDPLRDQLDDLAAAVTDGRPAGPGVVDGLRAMAVVEAAVRSAGEGGEPVVVADLVRSAGATDDEVALLAPSGQSI